MTNPKINWKAVGDVLGVPLVILGSYVISDVVSIASILLGIERPVSLIMCGWAVGLVCGAFVMHFVSVRPKDKLLKDYETMTDDMLAIIKHLQAQLRTADRKRRVEGDEWKSEDP